MESLLITGASGLLGSNLVLAARTSHIVTAVCHRHPISVKGVEAVVADLTRPGVVDDLIAGRRPTWVVHCAAAADVDRCEEDPQWASLLNTEVAGRVARACARVGARLVHVSTDAVFDGERGGYRESDVARPVNVYGQTKLEGEGAVLDAHPAAVVLRTNFFGWHPWARQGLAEWILGRFATSQSVEGFVDSWVSPILVNELARLILAIAHLGLSGVYHVIGTECLSKYDLARRLAREFGFDEDTVRPAHIGEAGLRAPRPRNLCLDGSKLKEDAGLSTPGVDESLSAFRRLAETGYVAELKRMVEAAGDPA